MLSACYLVNTMGEKVCVRMRVCVGVCVGVWGCVQISKHPRIGTHISPAEQTSQAHAQPIFPNFKNPSSQWRQAG